MSSAKKLTLLLILLTLVLAALLTLRPDNTTRRIQVDLTENTLVQSLDGQRRYFLIQSAITGKQLINVPFTAECETGENITIEIITSDKSDTHYRFISCP